MLGRIILRFKAVAAVLEVLEILKPWLQTIVLKALLKTLVYLNTKNF